jgi:S-adenosylmethionine uptake transporter
MSKGRVVSTGENLRAAGLVCLVTALFAVSDTVMKHLFQTVPVGQVMGLRGILICLLLLAVLVLRRRRFVWAHAASPVSLARAILEVAISLSFFMSLLLMPLADATVLLFAAPIIMTVMATLFLGEQVGVRRWSAVLVGFLGVLLVAGPTNRTLGVEAVFPLLAATLVAIRDVITRYVPLEHDSTTVALTTAIAVSLAGCLSLPLGWTGLIAPWVWPGLADLVKIAVGAVLIATAYIAVVAAYRLGEMSFLAPFRYSSIPLVVLLSWTVFGDRPTPSMLVGAAIITFSGIFIFTRERQLARRAQAAGPG